jgi:hypothetical protein
LFVLAVEVLGERREGAFSLLRALSRRALI